MYNTIENFPFKDEQYAIPVALELLKKSFIKDRILRQETDRRINFLLMKSPVFQFVIMSRIVCRHIMDPQRIANVQTGLFQFLIVIENVLLRNIFKI
jgi:hypothetical protein